MTTPIDTTRLRERAETVRDAGAKLASARAHWDACRNEAGDYTREAFKAWLDAGEAHRVAADALRAAQKRLYRDAPPDGIILALLDEVERLRALVAQVPSDVEFFALRAVASEDPEDITDDESTLACEYVERVKRLRTKRPEEGGAR